MSKVKICGLTEIREAEIVNQYSADYAGMVLFYPKSRRNLPIGKAKEIITVLSSNIKKVAGVVSPTVEQIKKCKKALVESCKAVKAMKSLQQDKVHP